MLSTQVLAEFAAILLHKMSPRARPADVEAVLNTLGPIGLIALDGEVVRRAVEAHAKYGLHFYDGMIVAAAERGACGRVLSEDLNAGQDYFGVKVENPFGGARGLEAAASTRKPAKGVIHRLRAFEGPRGADIDAGVGLVLG